MASTASSGGFYASATQYVTIFASTGSGVSVDVKGGSYKIGGTDVINSSGQFVGAGVSCTGYVVAAAGFNPYVGGVQYTGTTGTTATIPIRTNAGDLEYYNGSTWVSVGSGGVVLTQGTVIVVKGGAVTSMS